MYRGSINIVTDILIGHTQLYKHLILLDLGKIVGGDSAAKMKKHLSIFLGEYTSIIMKRHRRHLGAGHCLFSDSKRPTTEQLITLLLCFLKLSIRSQQNAAILSIERYPCSSNIFCALTGYLLCKYRMNNYDS